MKYTKKNFTSSSKNSNGNFKEKKKQNKTRKAIAKSFVLHANTKRNSYQVT